MPGLYTISADRPFLDTLIAGLLDWEPDRLADTLLLLPSRRACLAARQCFLRVGAGRTLLLPRLLPIGEPDEAELLLDPEIELSLPPAIGALRRRLLLMRLVLAKEPGMAHEQAVRLAGALERFLDELHNEEVELGLLAGLVPGDLAEHWQETLRFLQLLQQGWPALLAAEGCIDAADRRRRLLDEAATKWRRQPPAGPVVAAGVTGTIPSVARLVAAVAALPDGTVVLPALDEALDDLSWDALAPSHPQFGLKRLLAAVGAERQAVRRWTADRGDAAAAARVALWSEVLRPAEAIDAWRLDASLVAMATAGLDVSTAPDPAAEALQIALRLRQAVEVPGKHAILVTADRSLGRRVAAELLRWDVRVDDSAGVPLDQSPPGTFLLLTAHMVAGGSAPVPLLSALKHPLASGGLGRREFRRYVRALDRAVLRGPRTADGLEGLIERIHAHGPDAPWPAPLPPGELLGWLERLAAAARPFTALLERPVASLADLVAAHLAFAEWLARDPDGDPRELWAREGGSAARELVDALALAAGAAGDVPGRAYPALLAMLMATQVVRPRQPTHPRLAILGQLESRLVHADLVIVGGLNEGTWPPLVDSGPWLNRAMRDELGLPPAEQAVGFAAHDFSTCVAAPEVVLSRAAKDGTGAPTVASRWLARLDAVLAASGARDRVEAAPGWAHWAALLDQVPGRPRPCARPEPRPPAAARPRELWARDVERLLHDPYEVYARRILALRQLDGLDADAGAPERGQIIHAVLDEFVREWPVELPPEPLVVLERIGLRHFARHAQQPQVFSIWWPRFLRIAAWFAEVERRRRSEVARVVSKAQGAIEIEGPGGTVRIRARIDRVEIGRDGRLGIVGYRTGPVPTKGEVARGLAPRLAIEALIAQNGGLEDLEPAPSTLLAYLQLKGGDPLAGMEHEAGGRDEALRELLAGAQAGLARLLAHFDDPAVAYVPVPRPDVAQSHGAYEHLARVGEWWGSEDPA